MRQSLHDGVCVAELLVAARRRITEQRLEQEQKAEKPNEERKKEGKQEKRFRPLKPRHLRLAILVASAIAGNDDRIEAIPEKSHDRKSRDPWPPAHRRTASPRTRATGCAGGPGCAARSRGRPPITRRASTQCWHRSGWRRRIFCPRRKGWRGRSGLLSALSASLTTSTPRWNARMTRLAGSRFLGPEISAGRIPCLQEIPRRPSTNDYPIAAANGLSRFRCLPGSMGSRGLISRLIGGTLSAASLRTSPVARPRPQVRDRMARRSRRPSGRAAVRRRRSLVPPGQGRVCGRR